MAYICARQNLPNMQISIETERLLIRPLALSDDKGMFELDSDPEVHRFLGRKPVQTIDECRKVIEFVRQQYIDFGIGRWAVTEKENGDFVGWTGFKMMKDMVNGHTGHYDFGYRLVRRFWGKGYATESGKAALEYGVRSLKFADIYGMTDVDNVASRRVLEKLGFRYVETFAYDAEPNWRDAGAPTTWYRWEDRLQHQ